jgi:hypothetical protein
MATPVLESCVQNIRSKGDSVPRKHIAIAVLFGLLAAFAVPVYAASGLVYLVNATNGGPTIFAACKARGISATAAEHSTCYLSESETFNIGLAADSLVPVSVDQEGEFEATLPGGTKIRGAFETVIHLSPGLFSYYVYAWQVIEPSK